MMINGKEFGLFGIGMDKRKKNKLIRMIKEKGNGLHGIKILAGISLTFLRMMKKMRNGLIWIGMDKRDGKEIIRMESDMENGWLGIMMLKRKKMHIF